MGVHRCHAEARLCFAASAMHIRKYTNTAVDCDGDCFTHSDFGSQELSSVCDSTAYWGNRCATVQNCDHRSSTAGAPRRRSPTRWVVAAFCIIPQCFKIVLRILAHSSRAAPKPQTCGFSRVAARGQAKPSQAITVTVSTNACSSLDTHTASRAGRQELHYLGIRAVPWPRLKLPRL